jgi:hypothetical protein
MNRAKRGGYGIWTSRAAAGALCVQALFGHAPAAHAQADASPIEPGAAKSVSDFPTRLAITVVADEHMIPTLQQRVGSWFTDGTQVSVTVTSEVDEEQLLATPSTISGSSGSPR